VASLADFAVLTTPNRKTARSGAATASPTPVTLTHLSGPRTSFSWEYKKAQKRRGKIKEHIFIDSL
jgi:hypothetical protein